MPGDVSGSAISAVLPKYTVLRHRSHRVISAVNIPYLLQSFQHLLILYGLSHERCSRSGVQYVILKNLAQKADFDLKIETIQEKYRVYDLPLCISDGNRLLSLRACRLVKNARTSGNTND